MTRETLLKNVPIPAANVHAVADEFGHAEKLRKLTIKSCENFSARRRRHSTSRCSGLGPEGHTASLFPDSPALEEKQHWVVPVHVKPSRRIV